jgi:UDP-glucose-4-epimerase GalE
MILVTGGAGYIGRHIARALGSRAWILDDFRASGRSAAEGRRVLEADLAEAEPDWSEVEAVIHCAGSTQVGESMEKPGLYWANNVGAAAAFFGRAPRGLRVIFSSTAAVYGEPERTPIPEEHPCRPLNPYGSSKLAAESMLRDLGCRLTVLRYFNAAGGDEEHRPETHLIPNAIDAALGGEPLSIFGDGLHVRDYVHVEDLARAHLLALERPPGTFNLGSGKGSTVREVVETARRVLGRPVPVREAPPRPGDPRALVADISRARRELGWEPARTLEDMISSAAAFRRGLPR